MIIISACLCGVNCRYNGESNLNEKVLSIFKKGNAVLICPEQLGGLETPREPQEIQGGTGMDVLEGKAKVVSKTGKDSTEKFIKGAYETLKIAKNVGAKLAILKANSPSCGCGEIYNGFFQGKLIKGNGATAELLMNNQIKVITEKDINGGGNFYGL